MYDHERMTAQIPESFTNDCARVDFGRASLYGVFRRDESGNEILATPGDIEPKPDKRSVCSANWKGYIGRYRLDADGRLWLEAYGYPFSEQADTIVRAHIDGDFFLDIRESFLTLPFHVPFENGRIVEDKSRWERPKRTF
jgi:hypothetical protein